MNSTIKSGALKEIRSENIKNIKIRIRMVHSLITSFISSSSRMLHFGAICLFDSLQNNTNVNEEF